jgi:hypothetical protein
MVNFRGFSAEIANVLAGIAASSNCFILKTIYVTPSREPLPQIADLQPPAPPPPPPRYQLPPTAEPANPFMQPNNPFMQNDPRNRFRERRQEMMPRSQYGPASQAPPPLAGPVTILTETPLFVTIYIDVVKLKAPEAPAPAAAPVAGPAGRTRKKPAER